jgi:serine/threonine protein kinase
MKREVSQSVANLGHSVKRLAIEEQEKLMATKVSPSSPTYRTNLEPVLSTSRDDFDVLYEKLNEIGRGGFSTVYRCRDKKTKQIYAVKVWFSVSSLLLPFSRPRLLM